MKIMKDNSFLRILHAQSKWTAQEMQVGVWGQK